MNKEEWKHKLYQKVLQDITAMNGASVKLSNEEIIELLQILIISLKQNKDE